MSNTKQYFEVTQGKTHKVFGPYPSVQAARKASFFYRDINTFYKAQNNNRNGRAAFMTSGYEDAELAGAAADPGAFGYSKWLVKAKAPMHRSWRTVHASFRATYFADAYKTAFGEAAE